MDGKIGRTNIVPDIRPENIDTYTETNTQEDGMEQSAEYKIVDANPIIGGVLDRLALFRTHASAVWYNKMKNITVLQKLDNLAGNIGTLTQLATTDKTSLVNAINELNANIGKKQDASTAITTGNIGQQSVKHATTAGSASAVAWGNVSGKPGTYPPSGHNHDDRYYTETEANNLLGGRARIVRQSWGKSLSIQMPHGIIIDNYYNAYIIWVAGNPGNYQYQKNNFAGEDSLNFSVNANTGVLSVSSKNNTDTAITYIGA